MTDTQRKTFFTLFNQACSVQGVSPSEREEYRHALIKSACSVSSLKEVGAGKPFDKLMYAAAMAAEDWQAAMHYGIAEARRLARMAEALVHQIWEIQSGMPEGEHRSRSTALNSMDYIRSVLRQAGWMHYLYTRGDEWYLDLTLDRLQKLIMMLDTHRRRLIHACPAKINATGDRQRMTFDINAVYTWGKNVNGLPVLIRHLRSNQPSRRKPYLHIALLEKVHNA